MNVTARSNGSVRLATVPEMDTPSPLKLAEYDVDFVSNSMLAVPMPRLDRASRATVPVWSFSPGAV